MAFHINDIPIEDTVYIVIEGTPLAVYDRSPDGKNEADSHAASCARLTEKPYTVLLVPRATLEMGSVARYLGVVIDILKESDLRDDD